MLLRAGSRTHEYSRNVFGFFSSFLKFMNKKLAIVLLVVLIIAIGWYVWDKKINSSEAKIEKLMQINGSGTLSEIQKKTLIEVKEKLLLYNDNYSALLDLALIKQAVGDLDGALALYEKMRELRKNDLLPLNNSASIYFDRKEYEKAEAAHLRILNDITPKWMNSYNELYSIYQFHLKDKRGSFESVLLNGIEQYEEEKAALTMKTAIYYDELMNNVAKAIEYYEKAVKLSPNNQEAKKRLKELKLNK
jgi:tetratricopeptide (TPR) repeat protein